MIVKSLDDLYASNNDEDSEDYGLAIFDRNPDLQILLQKVGGWRGLFDTGSHEFKEDRNIIPTKELMSKKWECVKLLMEFLECEFDGLVYLVARDWNTLNNCYRLDSIPRAVYYYASYFREAEDYLMRCRHPLFKHFQSLQTGELHWKESISKLIQKKDGVFEDISSLLLDSKLPD